MAPHASAVVLVTGASGFVGRALCDRLSERGYTVRCATRSAPCTPHSTRFETVVTGAWGPDTDWSRALAGVTKIIHLAARTHVLRETARDAYAEYRRINVDGTRALAHAAVRAGVHRLVFLSSIKVNGERTDGTPFDEAAAPRPEDAYGVSKWEAEQVLGGVARDTGLEVAIVRSPLVYGPGVKGNFLRLMHWTARGIPLPLASVSNRRSLTYVDNLADALIAAGCAATAAGKTYLVSDGKDVSTPDLIRSIAEALRVRARLFPCPPALLLAGATVLARREEMRRLTGSLQIDGTKIRRELGWMPCIGLAEGLARTAQWYYSQFPAKSKT